jgi:hypothetical protein
MRDVPRKLKLGLYSTGSFVAEDDVLIGRKTYSCTLRCASDQGSIYKVDNNALHAIKQANPVAWSYLIENVRKKEGKKQGRNIISKPIVHKDTAKTAEIKTEIKQPV